MDDIPRLPKQYLEKAKDLACLHRTKKNCKACYDRGYLGTNEQNLLVTCHKCVDGDEVNKAWCSLVRETPELDAMYGDYFEDDDSKKAAAVS